jgi:multiple sugar transport system permease protein
MTDIAASTPREIALSPALNRHLRRLTATASVTLFGIILMSAFLMPAAYMTATAFKERSQLTTPGAPLWPAVPSTYEFEGEAYPVYAVPTESGIEHWALVRPGREQSEFIDPGNPGAGPIVWDGRWRTLDQDWSFSLRLENFSQAFELISFWRLFVNTFAIAILGTIGTLISSVCVAYGFSRFNFPGRWPLFLLLLATIILPFQVTLIPTFAVFLQLGWVGTWLPLIVPHFFSNAYNVFLLRQYFVQLPRELDEAAMIDGAGPFRILVSVILPQAKAALVAVALFHFFFAWNDYFQPLIYLQGKRELQPLAVGIADFNALYSTQPTLIQAAAIMTLALPVVVFFLAQRAFMRGVVVTGVEK